MTIPSPQQLLSQFGLAPKHSFGQNFLTDPRLTGRIAELAVFQPGVSVIEIGAGLGALTDELLARDCRLTVIERDRDLVPVLGEIFSEHVASSKLEVLEHDAKQVDFEAVFQARDAAASATGASSNGWVLTGNLPYQITGPLLEKAVHLGRRLQRAVFLVQKEVGDRLAAQPSTKEYGALTVFTQAQFQVERAFVIKPGAFHPRPRVDSAVVVLKPRAEALTEETTTFRTVVKNAFAARRKTLRNAWKGLLPPEQLQATASECGIALEARGETLSPEQFAAFAFAVERARGG